MALTAMAVLLLPASAVPAGRITLFGARSGSHLQLRRDGRRIFVDGNLGRVRQIGCHRARRGPGAVCSLSDVYGIEIATGRSGDLVQVRDPMPVPVTVYLGGGRDKFVGNAEPDNCFPQGARRNRCIGAGGNDVCITGPRNSDCVGGPGRDYCRTGTGSDGCWGGPGRDVCVMGPGEDGCHGGPGNDRLYGGRGADQLYGMGGHDYCDGGRGRGKSHSCEAGPRH
jgi:Ca2+-binding RTX toxin-like protein